MAEGASLSSEAIGPSEYWLRLGTGASLFSEAMAANRRDGNVSGVAGRPEGLRLYCRGAASRYHRHHGYGKAKHGESKAEATWRNNEASEQGDEADEAGASDGASQLIPGVRRLLSERRKCTGLGPSVRCSEWRG